MSFMWIISFNLCDSYCNALVGMKDLDVVNTVGNQSPASFCRLIQLMKTALPKVTSPSRDRLDPVTVCQRGVRTLSFGFNWRHC